MRKFILLAALSASLFSCEKKTETPINPSDVPQSPNVKVKLLSANNLTVSPGLGIPFQISVSIPTTDTYTANRVEYSVNGDPFVEIPFKTSKTIQDAATNTTTYSGSAYNRYDEGSMKYRFTFVTNKKDSSRVILNVTNSKTAYVLDTFPAFKMGPSSANGIPWYLDVQQGKTYTNTTLDFGGRIDLIINYSNNRFSIGGPNSPAAVGHSVGSAQTDIKLLTQENLSSFDAIDAFTDIDEKVNGVDYASWITDLKVGDVFGFMTYEEKDGFGMVFRPRRKGIAYVSEINLIGNKYIKFRTKMMR